MRRFFIVLLLGCIMQPSVRADKAERTVSAHPESEKADSPIVARVGEVALSVEDLKVLTDFWSSPVLATKSPEEVAKYDESLQKVAGSRHMKSVKTGVNLSLARRVTADFVEQGLLAFEAKERGIKPDKPCEAAIRGAVERYVETGENAQYRKVLDALVTRQALAVAARKAILSEFHYTPDQAVVSNVMGRVKLYNERMLATNRLVRARAAQAAMSAGRKGADFKAIAVSCGVAEEGDDLALPSMDAETFKADYPEVFDALGKSAVGTVASPIESDNSLLVCKLVEKTAATEDDPAQYTVMCMRFPFAVMVTERSFEETGKVLTAEKQKAFFDAAIDRIARKVRVTIDRNTLMRL